MIVSRTSDGLGKVKEDITPVEVPSSKTKMIIKKTKYPIQLLVFGSKPLPIKGTGLLTFKLFELLDLFFISYI